MDGSLDVSMFGRIHDSKGYIRMFTTTEYNYIQADRLMGEYQVHMGSYDELEGRYGCI
jgi:hypothetical protein